MKKFFYFAAALALVACSNSTYTGNADLNVPVDPEGAINFSFSKVGMKKAPGAGEDLVGADAAGKLSNAFVVYGTKHSAAEAADASNDAVVFNNFKVAYTPNSAGTTESNTANWDYVGLNGYTLSESQAVKYWDLSTVSHTFYAFSSTDITYKPGDASGDKVSVEKLTTGTSIYDKGYTVTVKNGANMDNLYFSDRTVVNKADYGQTVSLTFRRLGTQVRVGFYETVPGYNVSIDKFYFDDDAIAPVTTFKAMDKTSTTDFKAALQNVNTAATSNQITVSYYDNTVAAVENRAKLTNSTVDYNYTLTLGDNIVGKTLGDNSSAAVFDKSDKSYTTVYPFEANTNPMLVRVDYTLTSTDGTNDVIKVKNARVVVPVELVQWKANTAYTYLFKISNNTNGTTGDEPINPDKPFVPGPDDDDDGKPDYFVDPSDPNTPYYPIDTDGDGDPDDWTDDPSDPNIIPPTDPNYPTTQDPEGLYPITFDAVVAATEDGMQQTISTLATNSVTTYQNGAIVNEYNAGDIYAVLSNVTAAGHPVIAPAGNAQVYEVSTTGDAISEASVFAHLTGSPNGISKTAVTTTDVTSIPAADGTNYNVAGVKFTGEAGKTYAYVYTKVAYVAPTYNSVASDTYDATETYYFLTTKGVYYAASGISADNFDSYKGQLHKQTATGTPGCYFVKVIKVQ